MSMKATRATAIATLKPSEIRAVVSDCVVDGLTHGVIYSGADHAVIFAVDAEQGALYAPVLLEQNEFQEHLYIRIDGQALYILVIEAGRYLDEYELSLDAPDDDEVDALQAFLGLYQQRLTSWTFSTNGIVRESAGGISIDDVIELPLSSENSRAVPEAFERPAAAVYELKKAIVRKGHKRGLAALAAVAASAVVALLGFMFWPSEKVDVAPVARVAPVIAPKANDFVGLEDFYLHQSIEPLAVMQGLYRDVAMINRLRGWNIEEVKLAKNDAGQLQQVIKVNSDLGVMSELSPIVQSGQFSLNVVGKDAYLAKIVTTTPLFKNAARFHIGSFHTWLSAGVDEWWDDVDYAISHVSRHAHWSVSQAEITFPIIHPLDMTNLGALVYGLPYSFSSLSLKSTHRLKDSWEAVVKFDIAGVEQNG